MKMTSYNDFFNMPPSDDDSVNIAANISVGLGSRHKKPKVIIHRSRGCKTGVVLPNSKKSLTTVVVVKPSVKIIGQFNAKAATAILPTSGLSKPGPGRRPRISTSASFIGVWPRVVDKSAPTTKQITDESVPKVKTRPEQKKYIDPGKRIKETVHQRDQQNLAAINRALESNRINQEAADYLTVLYTDGMGRFSDLFNALGDCLGSPKTSVSIYRKGHLINERIKIHDINPTAAYMVHHRFDHDPMRNQFFKRNEDEVEISASSIVSVIVGAQKTIERSLEKLIDEKYQDYIEEVKKTVQRVIIANTGIKPFANAVAGQIRLKFGQQFITDTLSVILEVVDHVSEHIVKDKKKSAHKQQVIALLNDKTRFRKVTGNLIVELDKIVKPHLRLRDVWRVKCLFEMVPQARAFIDHIKEIMPDRVMDVCDTFSKPNNERGYRDVKMFLNIARKEEKYAIPVEFLCQIRTFFRCEKSSHYNFEQIRNGQDESAQDITQAMSIWHAKGVREYNQTICGYAGDLFERITWNVLFNRKMDQGLPELKIPAVYSISTVKAVLRKLDHAVKNKEVALPEMPLELTAYQEGQILRYMAKFILVSAIPCDDCALEAQTKDDIKSAKLFNLVVSELQKHMGK
jgi:hypothetical protein